MLPRIHTRLAIVALVALTAYFPYAQAQADAPGVFNCDNIRIDDTIYDISALKSLTYTVKGEPTDDHPSKVRADYSLNPCQALTIPEGEEKSHCKAGTWVCQDTKLIPAEGDPKTLFLRTIAGSAPATDKTPAREVAPSVAQAEKMEDVKELPWDLTLKGGVIEGREQSTIITFICDTTILDEKVGPALTKYENDVVYMSWKSVHACPKMVQLPTTEGMSGFSVFLTVFFALGLTYIVVGAVYNHQVYGAKGLDLLPNIDFWRDFPSLVVDVVRHVWDSVTGRVTSSRGYVSV
ncbi:hypothetical protein BG011_006588 [Mortierella polycephala]|uniref:Autophagy-related protein 27 n=1 Tax=Mortierella polycephala TaxID=41804 RepID=A0A9P6PUB1_9FUNG|nr:hypothetical protein BG011_006588 [Mortierella polycephala]